MPLTSNCVGRHVPDDVMSPSMRSDLTDVSLSRQFASRRAAVAGTHSRIMSRRSSEILKCRKAPYILYGCTVYLTELLVARRVTPDVTVA
jgi:IMP cyclohydrolase